MLEDIGLPAGAIELYRRLLATGPATTAELTEGDADAGDVAAQLDALTDAGLVAPTAEQPARYVVVSPDIAIEAFVLRKQAALERARMTARALAAEYHATHPTTDLAEVLDLVRGAAVVSAISSRIEDAATTEVLLVDKPPYTSQGGLVEDCANTTEMRALGRGVTYRVIYQRSILQDPARLETLRIYGEAGEVARVLPDVPFKLLIVDGSAAIVPMRLDSSADCLVFRGSAVPAILVECFEAMWSRAVPLALATVDGDGAVGPTSAERTVLRMLAAGVKDEVIARQMRVSVRTVGRYVDRLMHDLGAATRFQAGLQASKRGWV